MFDNTHNPLSSNKQSWDAPSGQAETSAPAPQVVIEARWEDDVWKVDIDKSNRNSGFACKDTLVAALNTAIPIAVENYKFRRDKAGEKLQGVIGEAPALPPRDEQPSIKELLDFLKAEADKWAKEVKLSEIVAAITGDQEKVRAMLRQAFVEGAYRVTRAEKVWS
jgi:hypothetical protein